LILTWRTLDSWARCRNEKAALERGPIQEGKMPDPIIPRCAEQLYPDLPTSLQLVFRGREPAAEGESPPEPKLPADSNALLVGLTDAARRLSVSARTLRRLAQTRGVASVRLGRRLLFNPADLAKVNGSRRTS
jgi:excisionase family DNA binding protein